MIKNNIKIILICSILFLMFTIIIYFKNTENEILEIKTDIENLKNVDVYLFNYISSQKKSERIWKF